MLLAMDVGNTNTVLGLYRLANEVTTPATSPELVANWRITTPSSRQTSDEFGILLRNLFGLKGLEIGVVDGIAISSVVPPLGLNPASGLRALLSCQTHLRRTWREDWYSGLD